MGFGPDVRREPDAAAVGEDELYMLDLRVDQHWLQETVS